MLLNLVKTFDTPPGFNDFTGCQVRVRMIGTQDPVRLYSANGTLLSANGYTALGADGLLDVWVAAGYLYAVDLINPAGRVAYSVQSLDPASGSGMSREQSSQLAQLFAASAEGGNVVYDAKSFVLAVDGLDVEVSDLELTSTLTAGIQTNIDWGDGNTTANAGDLRTVSASHTYAEEGTYTVKVTPKATNTGVVGSPAIAYAPAKGAAPSPVLAFDIINEAGAIVQAAYNDLAYNFAKEDKGIVYRFGVPATKIGVQTLRKRDDLGFIHYGSGHDVYFQYGVEDNVQINDFVTSNGAAIYIPDSGTAVDDAVGRFCPYQIDRHTISQRPQLMWQSPELLPPQVTEYLTDQSLSAAEAADLPIVQYRATLPADGGADKMSLVATQGSPTRGSRIFAVGTVTAPQSGICELAIGKIPTAISVTNCGEFAFVSVWDVVNFKGQIAVIALGGVPANRTWEDTSDWYDWWHDWGDQVHPGLRNKGGWNFMKVLGYVDLPSNMKAPTELHAYTGVHPYETVYHVRESDGGLDISGSAKEGSPLVDNRARFLDYDDFGKYVTKGGVLVVGSNSEKTVCFIDLAPLFTYFNSKYLDSLASHLETMHYMLNGGGNPVGGLGVDGNYYLNNENGEVSKKTSGAWAVVGNIGTKRGLGMAANQWPYPLTDTPAAMPTVIKTVTMPGRVKGIRSPIAYNYWSKDNQRREPGTPYWMAAPRYPRIWVVTDEGGGTCHIFSAGRWVPGTKAPDQAPVASEIAEIGTPITGLGDQITHVFGVKDFDVDRQGVVYDSDGDVPGCLDEMFGVADRANRRINWVQMTVTTGDGGSIVKSLEDSRMDVMMVDHVDAYYKSNKVILVTDFMGKCVRTYRVNTEVPLTYDGTVYPTRDAGGEYGGELYLPGKPFSASTSNAP